MKIHDIMKRHSIIVTPNTSFLTIWKLMLDHKITVVPVIDKYKKFLGFITKDDLLRCLYPDNLDLMEEFSDIDTAAGITSKFDIFKNIAAHEISTPQIIFARDTTDILRAFSRMITQHVSQLPILDQHDHFIGILTKTDILDLMFFKKQDKELSLKSNIATV